MHTLARRAESMPHQTFTRIFKNGVEVIRRDFVSTWRWAGQWAALLRATGIGAGDRVLLALPNDDSFAGAYFGSLMLGATPAPVAPPRRTSPDDPYLQTLASRAQFIGAKALVVSPHAQPELKSAPAFGALPILSATQLDPASAIQTFSCHPTDLALIQFTSGTVGAAKAVAISHAAVITQTTALQNTLRLLDPDEDWAVSWLPLFHDMGLIGFLLTPLVAGGEVSLLQTEDFIFRPSLWLRALTETRATITGAPPSAYALCARRIKESEVARYDLSAVRVALIGAETVSPDSIDPFILKFAPSGFAKHSLMPTYGLAENTLAVTMPPPGAEPHFDFVDTAALAHGLANPASTAAGASRAIAAVGVPLPQTHVAIVADDGSPLPERRVGEIIVRSGSLMDGYLNDPVATAEALREGWLYTGDLGYLAEGRLHITGRKKEVIIVGGRNYYPDDVEAIAASVPGVRAERVAAFGVFEATSQTEQLIVLAETSLGETAERGALKLLLRQRLSEAGFPATDVILLKAKSIQSTLSGKLQRLEAKERYLNGNLEIVA